MPETLHYTLSDADRQPLPAAYQREPRHLGLDANEQTRPFAPFFIPRPRPIQGHVAEALHAAEQPGEYAHEVDEVAQRLAARGHGALETGWARTPRGTLVVACLTDMPGVTAEMWDWWFGWHLCDTARYKLWHPGAHQFSTVGDDRSADRSLTDRQRYVDNVSYVDEYIGGTLSRLAIRFVDPKRLGFEDRPGTTHICARVGASDLPVAGGWLVHQVRATPGGSEMRSRFFLGHPEVLALPAQACAKPGAARVLTSPLGRLALRPVIQAMGRKATRDPVAHDLLHHCATEMNHLAGFLPALHAAFRGTP